MVYNNKLVAVVIVAGRPAREFRGGEGDEVLLPFGTEYELRFKNLNSTRAVIGPVTIDGEDALRGTRLVIGPNQEGDLKGFMEAGGLTARNRFKFIEKTQAISEHRGDRIDDGLIRVEYRFEKPKPEYIPGPIQLPPTYPQYPRPWRRKDDYPWHPYGPPVFTTDSLRPAQERSFSCSAQNQMSASVGGMGFAAQAAPPAEAGITVAGSLVNQQFSTTSVGELMETTHAIVLRLRGHKSDGAAVEAPVLTRAKEACGTCGKKNSTQNRFCAECGTCLV